MAWIEEKSAKITRPSTDTSLARSVTTFDWIPKNNEHLPNRDDTLNYCFLKNSVEVANTQSSERPDETPGKESVLNPYRMGVSRRIKGSCSLLQYCAEQCWFRNWSLASQIFDRLSLIERELNCTFLPLSQTWIDWLKFSRTGESSFGTQGP